MELEVPENKKPCCSLSPPMSTLGLEVDVP